MLHEDLKTYLLARYSVMWKLEDVTIHGTVPYEDLKTFLLARYTYCEDLKTYLLARYSVIKTLKTNLLTRYSAIRRLLNLSTRKVMCFMKT